MHKDDRVQKIVIALILFLSFNLSVCCAQQQEKVSSNGENLYNQATAALEKSDFNLALDLFLSALPILKKENDTKTLRETYLGIGATHYFMGEIDEALEYTMRGKEMTEKTHDLYGIILNNLSTFAYDKRDLGKSLQYDKNAITYLENSEVSKDKIALILNNLALSQEIIGDFDQSIKNLSKAIQYQVETIGKINKAIAKSYYHLGGIYGNKTEYRKAIKYYLKSIDILSEVKRIGKTIKETDIIQLYQRLAQNYLELEQQDSVRHYLTEAIKLQEEDESYRKYLTLEIDATQKNIQGLTELAFESGYEAIRVAHIAFKKFSKHPVIARQYTHLGEIYQKANQIDSAVHYFHEAFLYLAHGFEDENIHSVPKAEQCFTEFKVIRSLKGKARALYLRYLQSQDIKDLEASLATYEMTHEFVGRLKQDFSTMGSKQQLAGDVLEVYEGAIETAVALHEATGEQTYLEKAFFFAEANKAIILLESMNERMAQSASGIPDSLLKKEKQYRVDIAYYERSVNEEHNKKTEPDADKIKKWEDQLYTLRREYQQLIDQFEVKYPKYFKLKYDTQLAGLAEVRKNLLNRKTAFLEYFVGLEKVFLFQITKSDFQVFSFEKPENFQGDMQELLQLARKKQVLAAEANRLQDLMYQVYEGYLATAMQTLPKSIDRLLIVPDDVLNLVPFEILSSSKGEERYLIQDYSIGYAYSATLSQRGQAKKKQQAEHLFLGFAPSFSNQIAENRDCSGEVLANLTHSVNEITEIQALLGGEAMFGNQANRDFFLDQAAHYKIIHLATHACMDEENPMQSKVFFADEPIINQELFNLNLSADMAVLSACNTGSGQLVKGDGVMSLSKGFIHAGCPSALVSLWSVDDYSTSEIMISFYKYLKKGQSKDKAIRNAKLEFLASADKVKKHPFYWAAFIHMGDSVPLDLGGGMPKWFWISLIGLGFFGGLSLWSRNRRQAA